MVIATCLVVSYYYNYIIIVNAIGLNDEAKLEKMMLHLLEKSSSRS